MNSSMDRWNTFRRLAGPALFAACALALGTTLAVAQEIHGAQGSSPGGACRGSGRTGAGCSDRQRPKSRHG